ncbi:CRISPR system precrRNA processing endoribonuclease RAMP protein Cas6 [Nocardiopsis sp. NPDC007018]|uniref:CRISPR system precrRNA processing endoribonuclease RAMP protein Cas6 n=1 Tax=Nocardiopsis sp. NPDC007018 TaxID=3155721 RepID=UPI0034033B7A
MPRRWTLILRDRADAARPVRPEDCHGLLNRWWPQTRAEHTSAKRWVMNGWPTPLGDRLYLWTLTWLDDDPAPVDPGELVGRVHRVGDHRFELLSVTRTFDTPYTALLGPGRRSVAVRAAEVRTGTPVVTTTRDTTGERVPHVWPDPRRLFGAVHRSGGGIVGGSGAVGAVARFAPPALVGPWLENALAVLGRVRRSALPGEEVALAEHPHTEGHTVRGWQGGLRLDLVDGGPGEAGTFAALLELLELAGVGKHTARGFGAVRVDTVTRTPITARVPAPRPVPRTAHRVRHVRPGPVDAHAVAEAEEFGGTLFD